MERSTMLFMGKLTISTGPFSIAIKCYKLPEGNHQTIIQIYKHLVISALVPQAFQHIRGVAGDFVRTFSVSPRFDQWWCPSSLAKLVNITPMSLWFMIGISILTMVYKPTNITGGVPPCRVFLESRYPPKHPKSYRYH